MPGKVAAMPRKVAALLRMKVIRWGGEQVPRGRMSRLGEVSPRAVRDTWTACREVGGRRRDSLGIVARVRGHLDMAWAPPWVWVWVKGQSVVWVSDEHVAESLDVS